MVEADCVILLRPAEAARALGISRAAIYPLITSGVIPSLTIGRSRRVPVDGLKRWVAAQTSDGSASRELASGAK
jgi:excisionase family DNA binding protein